MFAFPYRIFHSHDCWSYINSYFVPILVNRSSFFFIVKSLSFTMWLHIFRKPAHQCCSCLAIVLQVVGVSRGYSFQLPPHMNSFVSHLNIRLIHYTNCNKLSLSVAGPAFGPIQCISMWKYKFHFLTVSSINTAMQFLLQSVH